MVKEDIKKVKDQGKLFERLSSDYDIGMNDSSIFLLDWLLDFILALQKNADASKTKRMSEKYPWQRSFLFAVLDQ